MGLAIAHVQADAPTCMVAHASEQAVSSMSEVEPHRNDPPPQTDAYTGLRRTHAETHINRAVCHRVRVPRIRVSSYICIHCIIDDTTYDLLCLPLNN